MLGFEPVTCDWACAWHHQLSLEPQFHELLRILSTFGYFKGHPIQNKVFGNSDSWKIGKLDIWIFGKSESRKLDNPSLARAVASLARTGNTSKYLGAFFRMGILKKFRLTDMSYFSSRHGVPGVPASLFWSGWSSSPNDKLLRRLLKMVPNLTV